MSAEIAGASERITAEVTSWPGVSAGYNERRDWAFTLENYELGHLHGDVEAHFVLPEPICQRLRDENRLQDHPWSGAGPGWGARPIRTPDDVLDVIAILRDNYLRVSERQ